MSLNQEGEYIPEILRRAGRDDMILLAFPITRCRECQQLMLPESAQVLQQANNRGVFYTPKGDSVTAQLQRGAISIDQGYKAGLDHVCGDCINEGKVQVECQACHKQVSLNDTHFKVGDPPEFICRECHETMPAAAYEKMVDQLEQRHQYDYE